MPALDDPVLGTVEVFDPPPSRRRFAAGDVLRLLAGVALVVLGTVLVDLARSTVEGIESDVIEAFERLPGGIERTLLDVAQVATSLVPLVAFVVLLVRRRWKVAVLLLLVALLATVAMAAAAMALGDRDLSDSLQLLPSGDSVVDATHAGSQEVATTTAIVTVAAPWLSRRWKQALWWSVAVLVLLRVLAVAYPAFDLIVAIGIGLTVGSLVLLVFGSPRNEPGPAELVTALRATGLRPRSVTRRDRPGTSLSYHVVEDDGSAYDITLRTPDEADADFLARTYRALRFRPSEVAAGYATLKRRMEHEALALTLAERGGVRAPRVVRLGTTSGGSAFLITQQPSTEPIGEDELRDPAVLHQLWREVGDLHAGGLAHRRLTLEAVSLDDDGEVWIDDFDQAETAPSAQDTARDVAELLVETAAVAGTDAAVDAAVDTLGSDAVAPSMRMLQPLALQPTTRARAQVSKGLMDRLRDRVSEVTAEPQPELEDLERVKPRTLLIIVVSTIAFYSLLPQLANLSQTVDAFGQAQPAWIVAAVAASAVTYLFAAISFSGAVPEPVPFAPNVRAQVAASFTSLVGPAGAGGFALTGRFLQRVGIGGSEAAASVAVNAVGGFAVHLVLLAVFVLWAGRTGITTFSLPDSTTILLGVAAVLALVGVLAAIGPVRQRVLVPVVEGARNGLAHIGQVFTNPIRVVALFGGSLGVSVVYIVAMACSLQAFGGGLGFAQVGAAYLVAVAVAAVAPTPGGLGVVESTMIAALTGFGLEAGVAISATLTFRLATFWLPILPGWLVLGWMQRNEEV